MKLFAAIRQGLRAAAGASPRPTAPPSARSRRPVTPAERAQTAAAVRRQEHYNFLHYDGTAQPDPVETTQI